MNEERGRGRGRDGPPLPSSFYEKSSLYPLPPDYDGRCYGDPASIGAFAAP